MNELTRIQCRTKLTLAIGALGLYEGQRDIDDVVSSLREVRDALEEPEGR